MALDMSPESRALSRTKARAAVLALRRGLALVRDGRTMWAIDRSGVQRVLVVDEDAVRVWHRALEILEAV